MSSYNLIGKRFGRLVVTSCTDSFNHKKIWICQCDCGKTIKATNQSLLTGNTISCGCIREEIIKEKLGTFPLPFDTCPYNAGVKCEEQTKCNKCGWNPNFKREKHIR